ncbi:MAG: hypothetical protein ACK52I_07185 [Pseudomonadota bacterium]
MSDKIKRVTPREIAEMLVNAQAYADTRFVLATEHEAEIERVREAPEAAAWATKAGNSATSELYRRLRAEKAVARLSDILSERDRKIERLRARVEVLEKHLGLMIANNLTGSCESEGMATDRAIAVLPDWLEKANGYTRLQLDAADEIVQLQVEKAKP